MSEDWGMDDLLDVWERELEEDAARFDIIPPCRPPPIQDIPVVEISFKGMLKEVTEGLPAFEPIYHSCFRYGGYFSTVRVFVPDRVVPVKVNEEYTSSIYEFKSVEKAEEYAARAMIRKLEKNYGFQVRDLNWQDKHWYNVDRFNCGTAWRRLEEENKELKQKIALLTGGWRRTLEGADHACEAVSSALSTVVESALSGPRDLPVPASAVVQDVAGAEEAVCRAVIEGISEFQELVGDY